MSNAHLKWARGVRDIRPAERAVLQDLADRVGPDGIWQIKLGVLATDTGVSRSTLRRILDKLAAKELLAFKSEAFKGAAQAAHRFILLRSDAERKAAEEQGFSKKRMELERTCTPSDGVGSKRTEGGGVKKKPGVGSNLIQGGVTVGPTKYSSKRTSKKEKPETGKAGSVETQLSG